ncbi:BlaI/MecI/CopY family transcriptional regulator [Humisphaera borealis]|uniref:BlaI/MecI/CopY family transcriptional regulator n=1 Tax=Humisphaera borealis TaxID=2807512 RepID=A0A7M2WW09_9BACT|nr:BlaI/MecI/CopY family transcriptional regulator [Humisphaera borealis]QOV89041.1 BlaI/MecI/CopY family transcriptional regulator [Humisphaera borealis]
MPDPQGTLTAAQYEIMVVVWDAGDAGVGVTDIWQATAGRREVARTTVLNLVDRLEKRGWLRRTADGNSYRYTAAIPRSQAESKLASGFLSEFFDGSAVQMVQSLLGSDELSGADIGKLRRLLDEASKARSSSATDDAKGQPPPKGGQS